MDLGRSDRDPDPLRPVYALLRAGMRAQELRYQDHYASDTALSLYPSVFRGAATHAVAYLLQALDEAGWQLVRKSTDAPKITHARHCTCSACKREDWTNPQLAPCGMHGASCARSYQPLGRAGKPEPIAEPEGSGPFGF